MTDAVHEPVQYIYRTTKIGIAIALVAVLLIGLGVGMWFGGVANERACRHALELLSDPESQFDLNSTTIHAYEDAQESCLR